MQWSAPYPCVEGGGVADYSGDGTAAAAALDEDDDNKFSLGRAVGIVVALWVGGLGMWVRCQIWTDICLFSAPPSLAVDPTLPPVTRTLG